MHRADTVIVGTLTVLFLPLHVTVWLVGFAYGNLKLAFRNGERMGSYDV